MNEALLVRFRSDDSLALKGFSASYVALNPLHSEEIESEEMATPFPGSLKNIYKIFDNDDDDEDDDDDDDNSYRINKIKYEKESQMGGFID